MRDMDYKPQHPRRRSHVPESVLLETARYIADSWEQDCPGCTTGFPPEKVQRTILDLMRKLGVQTIEDYEAAMTKDCGGMSSMLCAPPEKK